MFAASALALVLAAPPADTCLPRWRLNEGDVVFHKSTTVTEMTAEFMGQSFDQKTEATALVKYKVTTATRQFLVLEMTFVEVDVKQQGGAVGTVGPEKLKGHVFTITLDDRMRVTKFEGYDKFATAVAGTDATTTKQLKQVLPEDTVRRYFEQTFLFVPAGRVAVGDKWEQTDVYPLDPLGSLTVKNVGKLDDVSGDFATITLTGTATWKGGPVETDPGVKLTKVDIKADKMVSTYRFDLRAGRLLTTKAEMVITGTMTVDAGGNTLELKLKQKATVTGTLTTRNPADE